MSARAEGELAADRHDSELDLSADDSLPWLESDDGGEGSDGVDTAQVIGFVLVLLAVLAIVVGAVWYFSNDGDGQFEPDGSTIAAPDGPIKERPEDPGGKRFAGTGNVAPVVGEGGVRESRVAVDDDSGEGVASAASQGATSAAREQPQDVPASATAPDADNDDADSDDTPREAAPSSGVAVQLAAYRSRERAQQGWRELRARTDVLDGVNHRIVRGVVDIGTVYRLQALAGNRAAGEALCDALKADGLDCQVKS